MSGFDVVIGIGGLPVRVRTQDPAFSRMLKERYAGFLNPRCPAEAFDLLLACQGGFLVHSASGVRNGRACLFSGLSGAGWFSNRPASSSAGRRSTGWCSSPNPRFGR